MGKHWGLLFIVILLSLSYSCNTENEIINEDQSYYDEKTPCILSFSLFSKDNPEDLISDISGDIIGDSMIVCRIPHLVDKRFFLPSISYYGDSIFINGIKMDSNCRMPFDFSKPTPITIESKSIKKTYMVYVYGFTGLPVIWIETEKREDITSKDEYIKAHFRLVEEVTTRSSGEIIDEDILIKGRGNSSWAMPKKNYRLKFGKEVSLINEPKDKSWVLIPNYSDKTSLRNALAFYMGYNSHIEYTPRFHFVELMLNGRYHGLYQLCEKIKVSSNRVNVGEDGYVMEIDFRAESESDAIVFRTPHVVNGINIKEPKVEIGDVKYNYIKDYMNVVDSVLFSEKFMDPQSGWQKYLDVESFVDWYLISEISKNTDSRQTSSIYLNCTYNGKLKMGPLWDFDLAFGNCSYQFDSEGFWIKEGQWYNRLFEDPFFVNEVKNRFYYFYNCKEEYMRYINDMATYLKYSVQENDNRWGTFYEYTWTNYDIWGCYENEIQSLKYWLSERFEWLKTQFDNM